MDRWESQIIICDGGLDLSVDALTQGTQLPGSARVLQNYEAALEGGYRRISGFTKVDSNTVTGDSNAPILACFASGGGGFYAVRVNSGDYQVHESTGSGWSQVSSTARNGAVTKARFIEYSLNERVILLTDGANPAWKYNFSSETTINGTGAPTDPTFAAFWKNRLCLIEDDQLYLSAPNDDTVFSGSGAIQINVGDQTVGLKTFRDQLYVFCENRIYKLVGNTSLDFVLQPVTESIGCIDGDTIQEVGGDLIFLAPDGLRSIAGTENIGDVDIALLSRKIQPLVRDLLNRTTITTYSSLPVRKKSQYRLLINDSSINGEVAEGFIGKIDNALQGGLEYQWSTTSGIHAYSAASNYDNGVEVALFGHPTDGYVYQLESGNDFDSTNIQAVYTAPQLTFEDATLRKVLQKATVYTQAEGDSEIQLAVRFDFEDPDVQQPASVTLDTSGSFSKYGTAVYGTDAYSGVEFPVFKKNLIGGGFTAAFRYSSDGGAPHRIDSYQIEFAKKGRR